MPVVFGSPEATAIRDRDRKLTAAQAEAAKPIPEHERRAYIARADCGCVQGVCTDNPRRPKETAEFVADSIKCGLKVENVDWARYREISKEPTFFACPHSDPPADPTRGENRSRLNLNRNGAKVVDAYTIEGRLMQVLRIKDGTLWIGPLAAAARVAVYQPAKEIH